MDDTGFRYGTILTNSLWQHFVVMVVAVLPPWQYGPGYDPVPQATVVVVRDTSPHGASPVGRVTTISGRVGRDWGDWWEVTA